MTCAPSITSEEHAHEKKQHSELDRNGSNNCLAHNPLYSSWIMIPWFMIHASRKS